MVDEEGSNLSAGERQLVTIARAFLADPALLILDEATSSVDTRTELLLQQAMAALRTDRTSFVIAHRLSTIRDADLILVMEDGAIVEQGTHDELLAADGAYAAALPRAVRPGAGLTPRSQVRGRFGAYGRGVLVRTRRATLGSCVLAALLTACTGGGSATTDPATTEPVTTRSPAPPRSTAPTPAVAQVPAPFRDPLPGMPASVPGQVYAHAAAGRLRPDVAADPAYLYVPNAYGAPITTVIDQRTRKVVRVLHTGTLSQHVTPSYDLRTLYVEASEANALVAIDPATGTVERRIPPYAAVQPLLHPGRAAGRRDGRAGRRDPLHRPALRSAGGPSSTTAAATGPTMPTSRPTAGSSSSPASSPASLLKVSTPRTGCSVGATSARAASRRTSGSPRTAGPSTSRTWAATGCCGSAGARSGGRRTHTPSDAARHLPQQGRPAALRLRPRRRRGRVVSWPRNKIVDTWTIPGGGSPDMGGLSADGKILWLSGRYDGEVYGSNTAHRPALAGSGRRQPARPLVWPQPGRYSLGHTGNIR